MQRKLEKIASHYKNLIVLDAYLNFPRDDFHKAGGFLPYTLYLLIRA